MWTNANKRERTRTNLTLRAAALAEAGLCFTYVPSGSTCCRLASMCVRGMRTPCRRMYPVSMALSPILVPTSPHSTPGRQWCRSSRSCPQKAKARRPQAAGPSRQRCTTRILLHLPTCTKKTWRPFSSPPRSSCAYSVQCVAATPMLLFHHLVPCTAEVVTVRIVPEIA
jgi:hypothetical protein